MKNLLLILAVTVLTTACSSEPVYDENNLAPGIMQPVNGADDAILAEPELERQSMPDTMK
ncbi:hypothetical protein EDC44_11325 [Cricetibacter osteomyelitidis]|uniref:Lipoprotein n=1 Tax=Cricetibacter osteomyelitidis TaxID=1521931 RepID=A0A4R2SYU4_9PAST|nr:hypothetical protein [Cricetibacter osteomyelitidis]TCP94880.1 hypothetical protein EDC44_11325 [Cricetibacter osteomyelitidis]